MKPTAQLIKRQAQKKLLTLLRNKFPASQGDFFTVVEMAENIINNFYDEIVENECNLNADQKEDYQDALASQIDSLKFPLKSSDLDIILKNYGEEFEDFPAVRNPVLRKKLAVNLITMSSTDVAKFTVEEIVEIKELQTEFLWFFFTIRVKEILRALRKGNKKKTEEQKHPLTGTSGNSASFTTRLMEKQFLLILNENLDYLDSTPTGLINKDILQKENQTLLKRTRELKLATIDEVSDNLLLLSLENAMGYLKRLLQDINKMVGIFEEREFYFLNNQIGKFIDPELHIDLQNRPDIIEILRYLNNQRLEMSKRLRKMIKLRMEVYTDIQEAKSHTRNPIFTAKQVIIAFDKIDFFSLPKIKDQPKTKLAKFLHASIGASEKNLKTGIQERHLVPSQKATGHQKKDLAIVQNWFKEHMDLG